MNPNGFVEAASRTSHTSIAILSNTIFSSLTRAMFTARKMFATSFGASAWRDADSLHDAPRDPVPAADDLRDARGRVAGIPGILALGRERQEEVLSRLQA